MNSAWMCGAGTQVKTIACALPAAGMNRTAAASRNNSTFVRATPDWRQDDHAVAWLTALATLTLACLAVLA